MAGDGTDSATEQPPLSVEGWATRIGLARGVGLALAVTGAVAGLMMALDKKEAECPPDKIFGPGANDLTCYVYPHVPEGVAVAAVSLLLGILILFAAWIATALLVDRISQR